MQVIKMNGEQYDVRFFGGHHQRALIEKSHIRSISVNIHTLQVKRTSSWNKACEELKRHQDLLDKMHNNGRTYPDSSSDDDDDDEEEEEEDDDVGKEEEEESEPVNRPCKSSRSHKSQVLSVKCVK
jgi:hypothetical protein